MPSTTVMYPKKNKQKSNWKEDKKHLLDSAETWVNKSWWMSKVAHSISQWDVGLGARTHVRECTRR